MLTYTVSVRKPSRQRILPVPAIINLRRSNSPSHAHTTLSGAEVSLAPGNSLRLLNDLLALGQDKLDVARVGHVGVDLCVAR